MEAVTDTLDRSIIRSLRSDGRASHAKMARELAVSEGTVRRRLNRLIKDQSIRVMAFTEPESLGFHTSAFIGLQVDPSRVEYAAAELASMEETEHVSVTTGSYDIFIWVNLASAGALAEFIHNKVGVVNGVRDTETFVSLQTKKRFSGPEVKSAG